MTDHSKVDIAYLTEFGRKTAGFGLGSGGTDGNTLSTFTHALGDPTGKIGQGGVCGSGLRTNEAKIFNAWYNKQVVEAMNGFLRDCPRGMIALGAGAVVAAANYTDADAAQARQMDRVMTMFSAASNTGLDADLTRTPAHKAPTNVDRLPQPTTTQDTAPQGQLTPEERAQQQSNAFSKKYQKDMTWPTPPTPPDPHTKILAPGQLGPHPNQGQSGAPVEA